MGRWAIVLGRRSSPCIGSTKWVKPTPNSNCKQLTLQKDGRKEGRATWRFPDHVDLATVQNPGYPDQTAPLSQASRMALPGTPLVEVHGELKLGLHWLFTQHVPSRCCSKLFVDIGSYGVEDLRFSTAGRGSSIFGFSSSVQRASKLTRALKPGPGIVEGGSFKITLA